MTKNEIICKEVEEGDLHDRRYCYRTLAIISENATTCDLITDSKWQEQCKNILQKDTSKCKEGDNYCVMAINLLRNDTSLCKDINCVVYILQGKSMAGNYG